METETRRMLVGDKQGVFPAEGREARMGKSEAGSTVCQDQYRMKVGAPRSKNTNFTLATAEHGTAWGVCVMHRSRALQTG